MVTAKVLQQFFGIDDRKFSRSCVRASAEHNNMNHPACGTWKTDSASCHGCGKAFLGKCLNDPHVPWRHNRWQTMAIARIIPVDKWLARIKQRLDEGCRLCKRAREQRGASTNLPEKTFKNAFCDGMPTIVMAVQLFTWRYLYASTASKLRFVTPDEENNVNKL